MQYLSSPDLWNPERFSTQNRQYINWNAYMPFGAGPRNCIGMRIGLLESKIGLAYLLKNYRVLTCADTPHQVEFDHKNPLLSAKGGIRVRLEKC